MFLNGLGCAAAGVGAGTFAWRAVSKKPRSKQQMSMSVGGGFHQKAEMNVTPLIDVLLVLIIIFLLVQPTFSHGLKASAPESSDQKASTPRDDVVVTVLGNRTVRLNEES